MSEQLNDSPNNSLDNSVSNDWEIQMQNALKAREHIGKKSVILEDGSIVELPDGVRDAQEYKEYQAEQQAQDAEKSAQAEASTAETESETAQEAKLSSEHQETDTNKQAEEDSSKMMELYENRFERNSPEIERYDKAAASFKKKFVAKYPGRAMPSEEDLHTMFMRMVEKVSQPQR